MGRIACVHRGAGAAAGRARRRSDAADHRRSRGALRRQPFARQRAHWRFAGRTGVAGGVNWWWPTTGTGEVLKHHRCSGGAARRRSHLILLMRRKSASMRDCQPGPLALYASSTFPESRRETSIFDGALFGPRPLRIEAASSGRASAKGFAFAKSLLVHSGLSLTSRRSRALKPFFVFGIELPFLFA